MMLKNLTPRMAERGKIKIGMKGPVRKSSGDKEFQPPQKLDHFVVTTLERGSDGNFVKDAAIHKLLGDDRPRRIPVRLLFNDIEMNFMSRYACFVGRTMWCAGDGETASRVAKDGGREQVRCPCLRIEQGYTGKDKCKVNGALSVIIDGVSGVGNVWTFRTTSWNSVQNLMSAMAQIKALSGGVLAGLPLDLVLAPKEVATPDGQMMKAWVVSLQYAGTIEDLRNLGYKLLEAETSHGFRMRQVEEDVRRRLALPAPADVPLPGDDVDDVVNEFYSDAGKTAALPPPRPKSEDFSPVEDSAGVIIVYDVYGAEVYRGLVQTDAENALRNAAKGLSDEERQSLRELNPEIYDAAYPHASPDHIGAELGLPPLPEEQGEPVHLMTPDGEVLTADKDGLDRWRTAWSAYCGRTDLERAYVIKRLEAAAWAAKGVFAGKPKICEWIEVTFLKECREKIGA